MSQTRNGFLSGMAAGFAFTAARASAATAPVSIGIVGSTSEVPLFIADKLGYFGAENIVPTYTMFDSASGMIAPLGQGQLDVAAGGPSASLYNAVGRGVDLRIVADKGSTPKGYGYMMLLLRKDLAGKFKGPADLKGLKIGESAPGTIAAPALSRYLAQGSLKYSDVQHVYLSFPEMVAAMANGALDGGCVVDPIASKAIRDGIAFRAAGDDVMYPNQQLAVILYGASILKQPDVGVRFMRAYIRGCRYYVAALKDGKIAGANAQNVVRIMTEFSSVKDPSIIASMVPNGNDPNGRLNVASLTSDLNFFREQGLIDGNVTVTGAIDTSYVERALKSLPPYHGTG